MSDKEKPPIGSATASIIAYCTASILMTVTNKLVLSGFRFEMVLLVLAMQSSCTLALVRVCARLRLLSHRRLARADAAAWFPVSLGLVAMIFTGAKALQFLSIPLFTVFKNLTIIFIAYGERFFFQGAPVSPTVLASFFLLVTSSLIAAWSDVSSGRLLKKSVTGENQPSIMVAYGWMGLNCLCTAFFTLIMRFKIKKVGFKDFDTVYYNSLLGVPVLLIASMIMERDLAVDTYVRFVNPGLEADQGIYLLISIIVSSVSAFAISFATSWCVRVTSSTTYSMVGALNKLPISISGIIFFGDPATIGSVSGVVIALMGGVLYSYAKSEEAAARKGLLPIPVSGTKKRLLAEE
ncbi:hypothetical protein BC830DRAFT_1060710 [Chytriomyces sp. MP71]|nr:hypothetical protein BC830DRAFT_1060710 [Chytriomyces sp. MP71]